MSELKQLLTAYDAERRARRPCALATVVEVRGSAYRRPGARMLVTADGQLTGTISGGCLEGDARRRAQQVMYRGKPEIIVYDSTDLEDDLEHGAQLGCQGEVFILLEPIDFDNPHNPLELLRSTYLLPERSVLATVLKSSHHDICAAERLLLTSDGALKGRLTDTAFTQLHLLADMHEAMLEGFSINAEYALDDTTLTVFIELIKPAPVLNIYGAGNDARPLVELAARLGWRVIVTDGRPGLAMPHRFPKTEAVQIARLDDLHQHVNSRGYAVLMSHNYYYDLAVLRQLADHNQVNYIGILGPRKKTDRMLQELALEGIDTTALNKRIHSPIGLDIGGENADEIALSVMAELQAVRNGFKGGFLRDVDAPIHNRNHQLKATAND